MSETPVELEGMPSAGFWLEDGWDVTPPIVRLYLETFEKSPTKPDAWRSLPRTEWHLLAIFEAHQIVTFPVFTNPYAQRYLRPKHGQFRKIVLERDESEALPITEEEAQSELTSFRFALVFDEPSYGFGFTKTLDHLRYGLASLRDVDTIKLGSGGGVQVSGSTVMISVEKVDQVRRAFERNRRHVRERVMLANKVEVRNRLLAELDPERFPLIAVEPWAGQPMQLRLDDPRRPSASVSRAQRVSTVRALRENLPQIASDMPRELFELRSEIERVSLANMIERYETMLDQSLSEARWQRFFEDNIFILTMVFTRPVRLLHTQFHAEGSGLDGSGAQVGDFLFAEHGPALAIVEIKKPDTDLLLNTPYRNKQVFGAAAELSGAVTQVLYQQSSLRSKWLLHATRPELQHARPDNIRCVVIAGRLPTEDMKRRSFDIFRNACKDVDVVTFDELLEKLRLMLRHLNDEQATAQVVPF
ncbi:Shedu immune nuclease family protein [Burkholderia gladioli]|uniref:Shedu immune nuclease family protein n=2 Tax=Burkholderia gladioli TaxID=28095 RepID=UPI000F80E101|nr:Shedu immune nuclease family protein [Burkholderia gladioli]